MTNLIFCDFDGTVARRDVGYNLFHHFSNGKNNELIPDWKAGILSTRDCLRQEAAMVRAQPDEIFKFLDGFELCNGFVEFVELCEDTGTVLTILSEGLDFYISHILKKNNVPGVPFLSNHGILENGTITVEFPHENHTCRRCGNCKGERIAEFKATFEDDTRVIFIGDGYSDACGVKEADVIFAKKDLEQYCLKHNIKFNDYDDFFDVATRLIQCGHLGETKNLNW